MTKHDDKAENSKDEAFIARAGQLFDDSVQDLDGQTRSRLNRSRQKALDAAAAKPLLGGWQTWVPAGATAAIAVAAIVMWNGQQTPDALSPPAMATDFEILMEEDSLEMLEDLEFYSWMDSDELDAGAGHVG